MLKKPEPCQLCAVLCAPIYVTMRESVRPVRGAVHSETSLVIIRHSLSNQKGCILLDTHFQALQSPSFQPGRKVEPRLSNASGKGAWDAQQED